MSANSKPPRLWPDEVYEELAPRIGRACFGLLFQERRWVHRRVDRFSVLSPELFHRSVSVDLTVPELFRNALALPSEQWLVPIATLPKEPLRNFDLRDEAGRAVPIVGSEHNALIAEHTIRAAVELASGVKADGLSPRMVAWISSVSKRSAEEADRAIEELFSAKEAGDKEAATLLDDRAATLLLSDLASRYLLLAVVDDIQKRRVLKYGYEMSLTWRSPANFSQRLGWEPLGIATEIPEASRSASYHAEIEIPEELRIDASFIHDAKRPAIYAFDGETDRAALHAPAVPIGSHPRLVFGVRLERSGFPTVAAAVGWVTALILLIGALFGDLPAAGSSGAPLSVLLAGSALFAGAVARSDEHQLVRAMFQLPRALLVLNALAGLTAGAVLALGFCPEVVETTWTITAAIAVVTACILSFTFFKGARPRR